MRQRLVLLYTLFVLTLSAATTGYTQQNAGVALVIGNAVYPDADAPLAESVNDARSLAEELRHRGYDVILGENLKKAALQRLLDQFNGKINATSTALIFFSGFGIQSGRQSYMIPVDAQIWNERDVRRDGFNLDSILAGLTDKGAQVKIAIIDGSRRNPFERRFRSVSEGLAAITAPKGTIVMTSAPPDTVVSEGTPPVFMTELLAELKVPGATIEQTFNRTRMDVSRDTKGQQVPWFSSSLDADVTVGPDSHSAVASLPDSNPPAPTTKIKPAPTAAPAGSSPDPEAEARHDYVLTENIGTKQAWSDFVKRHPSGYYNDLATQQIAKLTPATAVKPSSAPNETDPDDLEAIYRRGQRHAVEGDYAHAVQDFNEVVRRDPKHAGAFNNRCWVRAVLGELQAAMKDCNTALQIAPSYPDALDSRGMVNLKLGTLADAIADYDAALRFDPTLASSLYGRGIAETRSGKAAAGRGDIDAAKAIRPGIADDFASYGIH